MLSAYKKDRRDFLHECIEKEWRCAINNYLIMIFVIFIVGLGLFFILAVTYRFLINKIMNKYTDGYAKGDFLSFLDYERKNEKN